MLVHGEAVSQMFVEWETVSVSVLIAPHPLLPPPQPRNTLLCPHSGVVYERKPLNSSYICDMNAVLARACGDVVTEPLSHITHKRAT